MGLDDFIEKSNSCQSKQELVALFNRAISDLGYDFYACGVSPNHRLFDLENSSPAVLVQYPDDWQKHYFERNYIAIDPIIARSAHSRLPFLWNELPNLTDIQRQMFNEAKEAHLGNGICVPVHGPYGETFVISLASSHPDVDPQQAKARLHLLVTQFHAAFLSLSGAESEPAVQLTARERECLAWSARGKSSWDIGMILNISEHTVNYHLKHAMERLSVNNRIMAVVKAIRMGLIEL